MNVFTAIGRVGAKDAVTRFTQGGKPVTGFSLAVDDGWGDNKTTVWLDCSIWGERGEKVAPYITKGAQIGVSGSLGTREHDGKTYITLRVQDVTLVGKPKEGGQQRQAASEQTPQRAAKTEPAGEFADDDIPF